MTEIFSVPMTDLNVFLKFQLIMRNIFCKIVILSHSGIPNLQGKQKFFRDIGSSRYRRGGGGGRGGITVKDTKGMSLFKLWGLKN